MSPVSQGILGGLAAGAATGLGALGVYSVRSLSRRGHDVLLGLAAGIMLAATFFALLAPAAELALAQTDAPWRAAAVVGGGLALGMVLLSLAHRCVPHEHLVAGREGPDVQRVRRVWLFVFAIALHNLPEGLAVGVGFAGGDTSGGLALAVGIGLQNLPEGLAVAAGLTSIGLARTPAFGISLGTGVLEALGAAAGASFSVLSEAALPWALSFAGGAMLFVVAGEVLPEIGRDGSRGAPTRAMLAGFLLMTMLDVGMG